MLQFVLTSPLDPQKGLQSQIQERLVAAILAGGLPLHEPLPASRILARKLDVSRNTITLVYERLAEDGYLKAVNRRGYFVNDRYLREQLNVPVDEHAGRALLRSDEPVDFARRLRRPLAEQANIVKPANWREFPYPFVYGQLSPDKISLSRWRDCVRLAGTVRHSHDWMGDLIDNDDPILIEQIMRRMLPQRGFRADPGSILITVGAQNALFLIAMLLCGTGTRVAIEEPGYVDARNMFLALGATLEPHPVDANGMRVSEVLAGADLVYVTPGHQSPTNVTMSVERRLSLVAAAERHDFLIVEDDYEHELNFVGAQRASLKSFDRSGRVLHVGSLSKPLFPGLRLGFIVAAPALIRELRALRRLMYRHPSALDQRAMALFLAEGHYDAHIRRQRKELAARWGLMLREIDRQLSGCDVTMTTGGSGLWLTLPRGVRAQDLQQRAAQLGVLIEAGDVHYLSENRPGNRIRMGYGAIAQDRIAPGIALLAQALRELADDVGKQP
ncbi:GntR family transcriptional regulator/MocR family aminotransferase [Bosea sp. BE125]|uniref:aminotransferase-like domain-containing protein n=1 Tax=Bosea sp. BE125 TaxID=2817909 RepID=UPI002862A064|nr:PLP-dependent aminotransferase family protein [Bosea sp. BE125]MDR6871961.1 GntR family transcriptional regulator/MocR family aminotransferase [Bosea sp. BE125]